jgi:thiamine pyrophosphokinase
MEKGICYIIGAGENFGLDFLPNSNDYVIAVDGGYKYLMEANLPTDLVLGDFDSIDVMPQHNNIIKLPMEKDDTDTLYAIKQGIGKGYKSFKIYCGTGGRISHTIANIQCLSYLSKNNCQGYLIGDKETMTVITNSEISFDKNRSGYISIFSLTNESIGVTIEGLKYNLDKYTVSNQYPIGVSNEFKGTVSQIKVLDGSLLIVFSNNNFRQ